jgi:signal transduction histidine kinase
LQQVFNNLISNSIKFTPENEKFPLPRNVGNAAKVVVRDTGQASSPKIVAFYLSPVFTRQ